MGSLNLYGDQCTVLSANKGADIATQRADDLDMASLRHAQEHFGAAALDIGCGAGGQSARLAGAGARVTGLDMPELEEAFVQYMDHCASAQVSNWGGHAFLGANMLDIPDAWMETHAGCFAQITCQRAIHYVRREQAVALLSALRRVLADDGKLFISCSGLKSELGEGYEAKLVRVHERFGHLAENMQEKHQIKQAVCLYTEEEFASMLKEAGWRIDTIYASAFGNIKTIASKE